MEVKDCSDVSFSDLFLIIGIRESHEDVSGKSC